MCSITPYSLYSALTRVYIGRGVPKLGEDSSNRYFPTMQLREQSMNIIVHASGASVATAGGPVALKLKWQEKTGAKDGDIGTAFSSLEALWPLIHAIVFITLVCHSISIRSSKQIVLS